MKKILIGLLMTATLSALAEESSALNESTSRAAFCQIQGVSNKLQTPIMNNNSIVLYSDYEAGSFDPSSVKLLRYKNKLRFSATEWNSVKARRVESKVVDFVYFTRFEDVENNIKATIVIDHDAKNKKLFNAAIILSDLDDSLESTYSLKAKCTKK